MATNVKILLRRGAKSEISADTLSTGELGFTTDSNQLYVGTTASSNEIVFDPFANAHSIVQTFLDEQSYPLNGLEIDEDLIIKNIPTLTHSATAFLVGSVYKIATLGSDTLKTVTAGSFVVGTVYTVLTLGTTTQAEWNTTAGTSAVTYAVGSTFTAATDGAGDGTATYVITKQEHWTNAGASSELTSGYFVVGSEYIILTTGDTDYTLIGAANDAVGTTFTATGTGIGTGTALLRQFTSTSKGTGTGTATTSGSIVLIATMRTHGITNAGYFISGKQYRIKTVDNGVGGVVTDFTWVGFSNPITAGSFVIGTMYKIVTLGTTTQAEWNTTAGTTGVTYVVGSYFTATGIDVSSGSFGIGEIYTIKTPGTTDFTLIGAGASVTSGAFVVGTKYTILVPGTTDFVAEQGAADSVAGTTFTATGVGTGDGTAGTFAVGTIFTATGVGTGTGIATNTGTGTGTATTRGAIGDEFTATDIGAGTGTVTTFQTITAGAFVSGNIYKIKTVGTTDFTLIGLANNNITSGSFVVGTKYKIVTGGTTDFTLIGAADSNVDTIFTATGVGIGSGTATTIGAVGDIFRATGVGTGTGTANWDVYTLFDSHIFASERKNVEVLTENSFSQVYANMHLHSTPAGGRRPDLFKKKLGGLITVTAGAFVVGTVYKILVPGTTDFTTIGAADSNVGTVFTATGVGTGTGTAQYGAGTFLKYAKTDSTSFFIDYSLKQTDTTNTFIRVGTIRVINGAIHEIKNTANTHYLTKLTDDNTEIWQDTLGSVVGTAEAEEFSNIEFTAEDIDISSGTHMKIKYTQDVSFSTEISYTVKRWTM